VIPRPTRMPWLCLAALLVLSGRTVPAQGAEPTPAIPLPEHPRPDFHRAAWLNLNGDWAFRFDKGDAGERERWFAAEPGAFPLRIRVPFPWGSRLSGVPDEADIAWYARTIRVPEAWRGQRVFLVVGASDWKTSAWLDGNLLGAYQGGYTPFELELTRFLKAGADQRLFLRVDDSPHAFKLEGKQGYGKARGPWQTVYLEARPALYIEGFELRPDPRRQGLDVRVRLSDAAPPNTSLVFEARGAGTSPATERRQAVPSGAKELSLAVPIAGARPWTLEDPFLYDAVLRLQARGAAEDVVETYFGLRTIGTARVPGLDRPYIALNGQPIYLQAALDQGFHPDGFYTWPSDAAMREEVLIARRLGLNAIRTHVKVEPPRKLYWADKLGVLVMSDVPNSWGEPDEAMRREWETAFRGMLRRDFNHPSIFSWVLFNEQWGLLSKDAAAPGKKTYLPETQEWVASRVDVAKQLDPTRLVEDNSPCCGGGHVKTDLNTWHMYLPGWRWTEVLAEAAAKTRPGSTWNYLGGRTQDDEPMLNSECGNVWGYEGSTGDVDWSFDYHAMIDAFRRHPQVAGWLYTEHHDVINEWNGYVKADRTAKETGLGEIAPGMTLRDLHAPYYVVVGRYPATDAKPGEAVSVPLFASFSTGHVPPGPLKLKMELTGHDDLGREHQWWRGERELDPAPWLVRELPPLEIQMPARRAVAVLRVTLEDATGRVLHRNFTSFIVRDGASPRDETFTAGGRRQRVLRFPTATPAAARWSIRSWSAMDGGKLSGAGSGYVEYRMPWPADLRPADVAGVSFVAELGAKELFGKDRPGGGKVEGDFMLGKGTNDPGLNPNAYPMTDGTPHPSAVRIHVNGVPLGSFDLPDDPADHRGLLSWHAQKRGEKPRLDEAGSYGYLVSAGVPAAALEAAAAAGQIVLRLEVDDGLPGGLAVYGERTGRYPLDPTLVLGLKN
jgi:hypothetical protein